MEAQCPCGSGLTYQHCCEVYLTGRELPKTPEALMRSRYTAYTKADIDYIKATMKAPASDYFNESGAKEWAQSIDWLKLEIISASQQDQAGFVEFIAHFQQNQKRHLMHELSEFRCDEGRWFYVHGKDPKDGVAPFRVKRTGRNDSCLCNSGKKYKKCCGKV